MAKTLERSLGFWSVFSISAGAMVSGIFVLPGLAAGKTGPAATLAYLVAGLLALPAALSKAELATGIPATGGTYVYLDRSMGPLMGTVGGLGAWFSLVFKSAFALVGLGVYLSLLLPLSAKHVALALCAGLITINIAGVKKTTKFQIGIIVCVFTAFAVFLGRGFTVLSMDYYTPFLTHGWGGLLAATGFVFISYAGVTKIASIAEEVDRPNRNIPLGILATLAVMIVVHVLIVWVLVGTVPLAQLGTDLTPIATAAGQMLGGMGHAIWAVVAILALTSMANAGLLSSSRYPYAMSRDRLLPFSLARVHPRFRTPVVSILLTGGLMLFLIGFMNVEILAKLGSAFMLLAFGFVNLSVIIFRQSSSEWYRPRFRSPGYPWVQLVGIVASLSLIPYLGTLPLIGVVGMIAGGALWYLVYARKRADRLGSLAQTREHARQMRATGTSRANREAGKAILVPFFGEESESEIEARIRIAMIFSLPNRIVHPVFFDEVPDETLLDAIRGANQGAETFENRFESATRQWPQDCELETVVTHDSKLASFRHASAIDARWILMGRQERSAWNFLIRAHKHWWLHHSPSSVTQFLYRDMREIQRIAVMTEPGPYDALLVHVADRLATVFDAETVLFHVAKEGDSDQEIERVRRYHDELRTLFRHEVESQIVRGTNRLQKAISETRDFDLLIVGAPAEDTLIRAVVRSFEARLAEKADCSVFMVQSPRSYSHEVVSAIPETIRAEGFRLFPFLHQGVVDAKIPARNKGELFAHISRRFAEEAEAGSPQALEQAFWQREGVQNTAMEDGVGMPHAVVPNIEHTLLGIFTLEQPIDFESPDESEVDICFVTVGPSDQRSIHLKILGRVAYLIRQTDLIGQIRSTNESTELASILVALDSRDI